MVALLDTSLGELARLLEGRGRADAVWKMLRQGRDPFAAGELAEGARRRLNAALEPTILVEREQQRSEDGTRKLLLELHDRQRIEMVLLPGDTRSTVCVSTQVGCAHACSFCLTGTLGLVRQLSAAEIVAQVHRAIAEVAGAELPALRNVVFMGMGEPLDNLAELHRACALLTDHRALALGRSHLTVSTVGPSPQKIRAAAALPALLAWSLHAADDALRRQLVPHARHSTVELRDAFAELLTERNDTLFVELALIDGLNDTDRCAEQCAELLEPIREHCRLNLLPMNPAREGLRASSPERVAAFQLRLREAGFFCMQRRGRGQEVGAACGQLAAGDAREPRA